MIEGIVNQTDGAAVAIPDPNMGLSGLKEILYLAVHEVGGDAIGEGLLE